MWHCLWWDHALVLLLRHVEEVRWQRSCLLLLLLWLLIPVCRQQPHQATCDTHNAKLTSRVREQQMLHLMTCLVELKTDRQTRCALYLTWVAQPAVAVADVAVLSGEGVAAGTWQAAAAIAAAIAAAAGG